MIIAMEEKKPEDDFAVRLMDSILTSESKIPAAIYGFCTGIGAGCMASFALYFAGLL